MKKVLIICYYWPPSGGGGVQRWLKFAKYLPENGWEPTVVVPENPDYPVYDETLEAEVRSDQKVIRVPVFEPYRWFRKLTGGAKNKNIGAALTSTKKKGWMDHLIIWGRGNLIIPDLRRFWIKPVHRELRKYIAAEKPDVLVTTGPPHSLHLIGKRLKSDFPELKWVADFRDPWTKIDYFEELKPTLLARKIHMRLERQVVQSADHVICVTKETTADFKKVGSRSGITITNGFDPDDLKIGEVKKSAGFRIAHIGHFMANRNSGDFWASLQELCAEIPEFEENLAIDLVGKVDYSIHETARRLSLSEKVHDHGYVSHHEAVRFQKASGLLVLIINQSGNPKGMIPGKLFEYIASGTPVLLIGPEKGDAADIIRQTNAGWVCSNTDKAAMKSTLKSIFELHQAKALQGRGIAHEIECYSRPSLTRQLVKVFEK